MGERWLGQSPRRRGGLHVSLCCRHSLPVKDDVKEETKTQMPTRPRLDNFTKQAQEDLERKAAKLGADAVIGLKFTTQGNNFMLLGTAVKLS